MQNRPCIRKASWPRFISGTHAPAGNARARLRVLPGIGLRCRRCACATACPSPRSRRTAAADRAVGRPPAEHQHVGVAGPGRRPSRSGTVMPSILAAAVRTMSSWLAGRRRCRRCRRPSPARRSGAPARGCPAPPTAGPGSPGRAGTAGSSPSGPFGSVANVTGSSGRSPTLGHPPRLGAVGQVPVGQQQHRRPVGERDPGRLQRRVEAVRRGARRDDRHRRLAVPAEHRLQQVRLLGLRRQPGRRPAALHVDDQQRQLQHHRQADRLGLQRHARARTSWSPRAPRRRTRRAPRRSPAISSSAWNVGHAEALEPGELVQDVRGRGDRVGAQEHRQPEPASGGRPSRRPAPCCR